MCICVSPSRALVLCNSRFSGEESALLTQQHSRGLAACGKVPSMHSCLLFTNMKLFNKEAGPVNTNTFLFFIKDAQYSTRLARAYLFDEMFDRSLASTHTPHII